MNPRTTNLNFLGAALFGAVIGVSGCASGGATPGAMSAMQGFPTSPPAPMDLRPLQFPDFGEATLSNGLRLIVVENRELPIVSVRITMPAGSAYDPAGKEGLAELTATLLTQGTESRTAEQISDEIESVGGSLSAGAGTDFFTVFSTVLTDNADLAFELMSDVLLHPTFPEDELARERARTLSALRLAKSNPGSLANEFFMEALYGRHPYGRSANDASVNAIGRDDIVAYSNGRLKPGGSLMVIAGDMSLAQATAMAERYLAEWTGSAPAASFPTPPRPRPTSILLVHRPGSDQSNILVGNLALRPGDETFYAGTVGNRVLGGGSNARLFNILREEKAWTYGAYSGISRYRDIGYFQANTEVRNSVTDSALTEIMTQIRRMRTEPVPADEIEGAKGYLVGSFPRSIETPQQIANQVSTVRLLGLPEDYLETYRSRLDAVTPEEITSAAMAITHPDSAVIVVVGDGAEIYEGLAAIAPVRIVDIDGNPMTPEALTAMPAEFDVALLQPGVSEYNIVAQGNPIGSQTSELAEEDGVMVYSESLSLPMFGVNQEGAVRFRAAGLEMISMNQTFSGGPMTATTEIAYDGLHVTGRGQSPSPQGTVETVEVDTTLAPGTVDLNLMQVLVPTLPLEEGATFSMMTFNGSDGTAITATLAVGAIESVTVPAGTFDAFRVQVLGLDQESVFLVSTTAPRRVVKIEVVGQPIQMELVR